MSGTITLERQDGNVETLKKVKIEKKDDTDTIRGISATGASIVFVDMKTKADFDLAIESLKIARECLAQ